MEKKRDDIKFLFNTLALTFTIVALIVVFQPYMVDDPRLEEVKKIESQLINITPQDVPGLLKSTTGKPVLFMAYATWCYYCRQVMPVIIQLMRDHEFDEFTPVFISLDSEPRKLSRYLVHRDFYHYFRPYVLDSGLFNRLSSVMQPIGSSFSGIIPYIAIFKDGRMVVEVNKVVNRQQLLDLVAQAK